jgi:hypothetical protein
MSVRVQFGLVNNETAPADLVQAATEAQVSQEQNVLPNCQAALVLAANCLLAS